MRNILFASLVISCLISMPITFAGPPAGHGPGFHGNPHKSTSGTLGTVPPGLKKSGEMPHGLVKKNKTPHGWTKGSKKGWRVD